MIVGAAFCPQAPVLVPQIASGAASELDDLRACCLAAIEAVAACGAQLVVLGSGPDSAMHSPLARGSLAPFGVDLEVALGSPGCGGAVELPLSLTIGAWLIGQVLGPRSGAIGFSVGPAFSSSASAAQLLAQASDTDVGLVVMGDGSARRSLSAPGHLDERAVPFDDALAAVLRAGDAEALCDVDTVLAADLLVAGAPAWRAGRLLAGADYDAQLTAYAAPYGVGYFVATWLTHEDAAGA